MHPRRRTIRRRCWTGYTALAVTLGTLGWYFSDWFGGAALTSYHYPKFCVVQDDGQLYVIDEWSNVPPQISNLNSPSELRRNVDHVEEHWLFPERSMQLLPIIRESYEWYRYDVRFSIDFAEDRQCFRRLSELLAESPSPPLTPFESELRDSLIKICDDPLMSMPSVASIRHGRHYTLYWKNIATNSVLILSILTLGYCVVRNTRDRFFLFKFSDHSCNKCGYSTKGLRSPTCPECGHSIDSEPQLDSPIRSVA